MTHNPHERSTTAAGICSFRRRCLSKLFCVENRWRAMIIPCHTHLLQTRSNAGTLHFDEIYIRPVLLTHTHTNTHTPVSRVEPLKGQQRSGAGGRCNSEWNPHLPLRRDPVFLPSSFLPAWFTLSWYCHNLLQAVWYESKQEWEWEESHVLF